MNRPISIQVLTSMFAGKEVVIESISSDGENPRANSKKTGVCRAFYMTGSGIDIELGDRSRHGFIPEVLTENSVEGRVMSLIALRRKIQLK